MGNKDISKLKLKYLDKVKSSKSESESLYLSKRLFSTYNRITERVLGKSLSGKCLDLGCGDGSFIKYCKSVGIEAIGLDYPDIDFEKDSLPLENESIDFVTLNAVLEHIREPSNILQEIYRVLKKDGLLLIRVPNWKLSYKIFYNDPTHVKPYSPESLKVTMELFGFNVVFLEPGLVEKSWFYWKLPEFLKWRVASLIKGGTKSIICVAQKR